MVEGLIQLFYILFRDVQYLEDCMSPGQSLSNTMKQRFTGVNQRQGQLKLQVAEDKFIYRLGTPEDQIDFRCRQIHAFAIRNWPDIPKEPEIVDFYYLSILFLNLPVDFYSVQLCSTSTSASDYTAKPSANRILTSLLDSLDPDVSLDT